MDRFFRWLEGTAVSAWVSESPSLLGLPLTLVLHTIGLAFLGGASVAIDARILGLARGVPLLRLDRMWKAVPAPVRISASAVRNADARRGRPTILKVRQVGSEVRQEGDFHDVLSGFGDCPQ